MEWVAVAYAVPTLILTAILLKYFAPKTAKRRLIILGIAAAWPILAAVIFLGR